MPDIDDGPRMPNGDHNCTDETKRSAYREALILKIAVESAQEAASQKQGAYRAFLKKQKALGVSKEAITYALARRFEDPDLVLVEEREKLKMMELSGFIPGLMGKLSERYSVEEPTFNEEEEMAMLTATDRGIAAGRSGISRDDNPYQPGSMGYVRWTDGWRAGQQIIADEMGEAPPRRGRGRPKLVPNAPAEDDEEHVA